MHLSPDYGQLSRQECPLYLPGARLLQRGRGQAALELGSTAFLLVHAVKERTGIEPDGETVQFCRCQLDVMVPLEQERIQLGGAGTKLAGGGAVPFRVVDTSAHFPKGCSGRRRVDLTVWELRVGVPVAYL